MKPIYCIMCSQKNIQKGQTFCGFCGNKLPEPISNVPTKKEHINIENIIDSIESYVKDLAKAVEEGNEPDSDNEVYLVEGLVQEVFGTDAYEVIYSRKKR